jgi:carboxyl-terminal processing protease
LLLALAIVATAFVTGGSLLGRGLRGGATAPGANEKLFDQVVSHVKRNFVDSLTTDEIFEKALTGMLDELGDPHTTYLDAPRLRRLEESTAGVYTGLGVRVDARDGWPTVLATLPNSPAERAGLLAGDRMVELDGRSTKGWTDEEIRDALRGPEGTEVRAAVERPGARATLRIQLTRGEVRRNAIRRTALLNSGVGYVDVDLFSDSTERELTRAIDSLTQAGMQSMVLDLRGNPGGLLTQGVAVADLFLDSGVVVVSMRGRASDSRRTYRDSAAQRWPDLPLAVLVDEATASAAEIVAGALQDHDRAALLGQPTFGKGSAQAVFQTSFGGGLKLTTARWYTPVGRSIERGVDDPTPGTSTGTSESARQYRTDGGRPVIGGGGIAPDLVVGDTALAPAEYALQVALGERVPAFRDALTAYAISLKGSRQVTDPFFAVSPRMRDEVWLLLRGRGFDFDRRVYDAASSLVSRLIAREVARYVFGAAAEAQRSIRDDQVIGRAAVLVAGSASPRAVLDRIAAER